MHLLINNDSIFLGGPATGLEIMLQMVVESLTALFAGATSVELQCNRLPIPSFLSTNDQKPRIRFPPLPSLNHRGIVIHTD
jgi:hypothetical protein